MSDLSQLPVADLKNKYGLLNFVETGTYRGDGVAHALTCGFERYYSCDLLAKHADQCKQRFAGAKNVCIIQADSLSFLKAIMPWIADPTFFWLDAHQPWLYDNSVVENDHNKFPVLHELAIIKSKRNYEKDVIMIDDLIVIQGSPRWHKGEVCDYLQINSFTYDQLVGTMSDTHEALYDETMEGVLTFIPKQK